MKNRATKPTPSLNADKDLTVKMTKQEAFFVTKIANLFIEEINIRSHHKHLSDLSEIELKRIIALFYNQEDDSESTDYVIPYSMLYQLRCMLYDFDVMLSENEKLSLSRDIHPVIAYNFENTQKIRLKLINNG